MIEFYSEHSEIEASHISPILTAYQNLLDNECTKVVESINVILVTDEQILDINQQYLSHDYYTDIITFELSSDPIIAELYISIDTVKTNAEKHHCSFNDELKRVLFHGLLHLCGYNDKSSDEQKIMRLKEEKYLALYSDLKLVD